MPTNLNVQAALVDKMVKSFQMRIKEAGDDVTFNNMMILTNLDEYECPEGSGIIYRRRMLKPPQVVKLGILQNKLLDLSEDPQKAMDNLRDQAILCLRKVVKEGDDEKLVDMTQEDWDETDGPLMEQIISAAFLMTKSFRKVRKPQPKQEEQVGPSDTVV